MLRTARCAARRGGSIATAIGRGIFVAIALLIVTVGVLSTESRLPRLNQNPTSWHTTKSTSMTECGGEGLSPAQASDAKSAAPIKPLNPRRYFSPVELPLPEMTGVPHSHGLRAPPRV